MENPLLPSPDCYSIHHKPGYSEERRLQQIPFRSILQGFRLVEFSRYHSGVFFKDIGQQSSVDLIQEHSSRIQVSRVQQIPFRSILQGYRLVEFNRYDSGAFFKDIGQQSSVDLIQNSSRIQVSLVEFSIYHSGALFKDIGQQSSVYTIQEHSSRKINYNSFFNHFEILADFTFRIGAF